MIRVPGRHESRAIHGLRARTVTRVTRCCSKRPCIAQIKRLSLLSDKGYPRPYLGNHSGDPYSREGSANNALSARISLGNSRSPKRESRRGSGNGTFIYLSPMMYTRFARAHACISLQTTVSHCVHVRDYRTYLYTLVSSFTAK